MPIDPAIPLQAGRPSGPFGPDMSQVWNSYNQAYRGQLQQNDLAGQNALRQVFQNQNALDPNSGLPLTSALAPVGAANPQTYLDTLAAVAQIQSHQNDSNMRNMLRNQKLVGSWDSEVASPLVKRYEELKGQNLPDDQIQIQLNKENKERLDSWQNRNGITDADRARFDKPFDPNWAVSSPAFQKRQDQIAKGWEGPYTDSTGNSYWMNKYLGSGAWNADRTAPYTPQGGEPSKQPKPIPRSEGQQAEITNPDGSKRTGIVYRYPNGSVVDAETNQPLAPGTFTFKPGAEQKPKELTGAGLMEAQIKNEDGSTTARNVRQERTADGSTKTTYADGPEIGQEVPKDKLGAIRAKGAQASQEGIDAAAEAIASYRAPPLSSYAMRGGTGPDIMAAIKKINPDYSAQKYYQANSVRQDFARGAASKRVDALNTAIQHLDVFDDLAQGLDNGDINAVNRVVNYVKSQLGHPEVTNFNAAQGIIADEVVKSVIGTGAVFDRQGLQNQLTNARSKPQLQGAEDTIKRLMAGQVGSLEKRWDSVGLPKDEFNEKLLPETSAALDKYLPKSQREGGKGSEGKAAEGAPAPPAPHITQEEAHKALDAHPPGKYGIRDSSTGTVVQFRKHADGTVEEVK